MMMRTEDWKSFGRIIFCIMIPRQKNMKKGKNRLLNIDIVLDIIQFMMNCVEDLWGNM